MILIWIFFCVMAYLTTNEYEFYALATLVGMVMGGIQSLSRATYSKLLLENSIDHASYFSFFDITFSMSIVLGTFSYGLIEHLYGQHAQQHPGPDDFLYHRTRLAVAGNGVQSARRTGGLVAQVLYRSTIVDQLFQESIPIFR